MKRNSDSALILFFSRILCVLVLSAAFFSGCRKSENSVEKVSSDSEQKKITIGFSIDTLIIERWRQDCDALTSAAEGFGAEVIVKDAANDVNEQISQIEDLINQQVDVLIIVPKKADSLTEVLKKAKQKKIPVISYDRLIRNADISLYVSVDCEKVGELMAEEMVKIKPDCGYWCIYGADADYNMTMLDNGVRRVLYKSGSTVDFQYFTPDWNYDLAYKKMNSLLDEGLVPQAVICGNDSVAENVIRSMSEHRLGNVPVVGQDADVLACRRIADGIQTATVYKPIKDLARKACEYACILGREKSTGNIHGVNKYIDNGRQKVPSVLLSPEIVTKENLKQVIVDSGFHTEKEIFR